MYVLFTRDLFGRSEDRFVGHTEDEPYTDVTCCRPEPQWLSLQPRVRAARCASHGATRPSITFARDREPLPMNRARKMHGSGPP